MKVMVGSVLRCVLLCFCLWNAGEVSSSASEFENLSLDGTPWVEGVGSGFRKGVWRWEANVGHSWAPEGFGTHERHDIVLAQFGAGRMVTRTLAPGRWFSGNLELGGQVFCGMQYHESSAYMVGIEPGGYYHFATGGVVVPYIGGAVGLLATDIGAPDLGGKLQFDQKVRLGANVFLDDEWSVGISYQYMHVSNGGLKTPNSGMNGHAVLLGVSRLF